MLDLSSLPGSDVRARPGHGKGPVDHAPADPGDAWMLITDGRIGTDDKNPTRIGIVLLHPRIGVALIEIAPR